MDTVTDMRATPNAGPEEDDGSWTRLSSRAGTPRDGSAGLPTFRGTWIPNISTTSSTLPTGFFTSTSANQGSNTRVKRTPSEGVLDSSDETEHNIIMTNVWSAHGGPPAGEMACVSSGPGTAGVTEHFNLAEDDSCGSPFTIGSG